MVILLFILFIQFCVSSYSTQTCPPLSDRLRQHSRIRNRRFDVLFSSIWPLEPSNPFGVRCCGGLFSCSDRNATCLQCGNSQCSPLAEEQPGCRQGDFCLPFGLLCDGHSDCDGISQSTDEAQCNDILNSFKVTRRESFDRGQIIVHSVSVQTCAAICFYNEDCASFSYAELASLEGIVIEQRQSSLGRLVVKSVCVIGCIDCGLKPHYNASSDLYRVTIKTQALRLSLIGSPRQSVSVDHSTKATPTPSAAAEFPRYPQCGRSPNDVVEFGRIVGGDDSSYGEFPWQVQIRELSLRGGSMSRHVCGGVIITNEFVLTAAHCMDLGENRYEIVVGQYDLSKVDDHEQIFSIQSRIKHPAYDPASKLHDICLILLNSRRGLIKFSNRVRPACLPTESQLRHPPDAMSDRPVQCEVSGWGEGDTSSPLLRSVSMPLVSSSYCMAPEVYGSGFIPGPMLCAGLVSGGADSCQGDSGGGLVCWQSDGPRLRHLVLTGLVSKGGRCGEARRPGVYTNVYYHIDWLRRMMKVLNHPR